MIYLVKNKSGAEFTVSKDNYDYCKGKKEYECRTIDGTETLEKQIFEKTEYPIKDDNSSWYTLSNGKRVQGEENAMQAESEL